MASRPVSFAAILFILSIGAAWGAPNFPVGTYTVNGSLLDWRNTLVGSEAAVSLQAVLAKPGSEFDGTVLAETMVRNASADGFNFALSIPLSTATSAKTAAVGDTVGFAMKTDSGVSMSGAALTIPAANAATNLTMKLVELVAFTNETDSSDVRYVPRDYLNGIEPWLLYMGINTYSPFADYDGDGYSNYAEYLAGTNPFDDEDHPKITAYSAKSSDTHLLSFEYNGGHLYGFQTTRSLTAPAWTAARFRTSEASHVEVVQVLPSSDVEDVGIATIYLTPAVNATNEFYRLEVK